MSAAALCCLYFLIFEIRIGISLAVYNRIIPGHIDVIPLATETDLIPLVAVTGDRDSRCSQCIHKHREGCRISGADCVISYK